MFEINQETSARVAKVRADLKLSRNEFAAAIGENASKVQDVERAKQKPSWQFLNAVMAAYPNLSSAWLLSGEGVPWNASEDDPDLEERKQRVQAAAQNLPAPGVVRIPLYDLRAAAGDGAATPDYPELIRHFDFPEWWLKDVLHCSPVAVLIFIAWGDSMKPDVQPGDLLIVDTRHTHVQADALYVFEMDGGVFIKKLQRLPGGKLKVISANQDYDAYTITPAGDPTFKVVGRVAFHGKVM